MMKSKSGFTLVEIIIVLTVIGILAALVIVSYGNVQAKSRDTKRVSDLQNIADAISTYRVKFGNDIATGSGCGSGGNGSGWFNETPGAYKSILTCLTEKGLLTSAFIDPFGCVSNTDVAASCKRQGQNYAYYKQTTGSGDTSVTCVYAKLEASGSTSDLTSANPCTTASSSTVATSYGMNYYVLVK